MATYKKTAELARKFDAAYPQELSARMNWWGNALGIDRVRLLRLLGMSMHQAKQKKNIDLEEIIKNPKWKENAQAVEGSLVTLLSLFHYDWLALAERIHSPLTERPEDLPSHIPRREEEISRLQHAPNGAASDLLIKRIVEGGPDSLSALFAYLS